MSKPFDNATTKEYNGSKQVKVRPYDQEVYRRYREKRKRKVRFCQLTGCGRPLQRFGPYRLNKYCCPSHAEEAKKKYKKEWEAKNRGKVLATKKRYNSKKKHSKTIKPHKRNENPQAKTYLV